MSDLLIVGCGIAGLSAAVTALQAKLQVTLLERAPEEEFGGNSRWTEAYLRMKNDAEVSDDFEERFAANAGVNLDPNVLDAVAGEYAHWPPYVKAHALPDLERLAQVVRADQVGDVAARAQAHRDGDAAEHRGDDHRGEDREPRHADADLVGAHQDRRDQGRALRQARERRALRGLQARRGGEHQVGDEARQHVAGDDDQQAGGERRQVVEQPREPVGEGLQAEHLGRRDDEEQQHHPVDDGAEHVRRARHAQARRPGEAVDERLGELHAAIDGQRVLLRGQRLPLLPGSQRYWGRHVLVPLGFRPDPGLPESALVELLRLHEEQIAMLNADRVELVPIRAFMPLSRAAVRLACRESP